MIEGHYYLNCNESRSFGYIKKFIVNIQIGKFHNNQEIIQEK
jgi:hypothetical protein